MQKFIAPIIQFSGQWGSLHVSVISFHFILPCFILGTGTVASSTAPQLLSKPLRPRASCTGLMQSGKELCTPLVGSPPARNPPAALRGQLRLLHQLPLKINCIATVGFIFLFSITLLGFFSFFSQIIFMRANPVENLQAVR